MTCGLLLDDDALYLRTLARALQRRGIETHAASRPQEALHLARTHRPDFALLDLKLGEGDGTSLELIAPLRAACPEVRIVLVTGYASVATAVEAIKRGACNYLCKPADADDVLAALLSQHADLETLVPDNPMSVDRLQWEHIQRVLGEHEGNISATARALGMHRRTLQRKLQKRPVRR